MAHLAAIAQVHGNPLTIRFLTFVTFACKSASVETKNKKYRRAWFLRRLLFWAALAFVLFLPDGMAQHPGGKKTVKLFDQARRAYLSNRYDEAQQWLTKLFRHDSSFVKAYLLQGDILASQKHLEKAVAVYRKGLALDSVSWPVAFFVLAGWEYHSGDYAAALRDVRYFLHVEKDSGQPRLAHARKLLEKAAFAVKAVSHPQKVRMMPLSDAINSKRDEYINFVNAGRSRLVFTRKLMLVKDGEKRFKEYFFQSVRKGAQWQKPTRMILPWDSTLNMGAMSLSADGRRMYFTGCYWPGGWGSCDIYTSSKTGFQWEIPQHLPAPVNTKGWESQAVISADGRVLFFASKRPGGKGGSDIWMCRRRPDGSWSKAENAGDSINTPGNEMAPFLFADGKTLYFSSDGRMGMGGYDLYVARKNSQGQWKKAVNAGFPVNTKADEINLFVALDGRHAWLSSDRDSGNYNIFAFCLTDKMRPQKVLFVNGCVLDSLSGHPLKAAVILTDLSNGKVADSTVSDPVTGNFLMVLHPGKDYAFHIQKKGYLFFSRNFNLKDFPAGSSVNRTFRLTKIHSGAVMPLHNILFGFDSTVLRPEAFPELDRLVRFLKNNPETKILIAGYTDDRGSHDYNLKLSQQRAKAVFDYLISRGIDVRRLQYKGFGEAHPITSNHTPQGRAFNRRTEIVIR
jgi:tetratricopeptide (TPR) repeat protein